MRHLDGSGVSANDCRPGQMGVFMTLGMSIGTFTVVHVIISLIAIVSGFIALAGLFTSDARPNWTRFFLLTTLLTSVTGFMFPFTVVTPAFVTGVISVVTLLIALLALYVFQMRGAWRWIYVVTALFGLYLNCFVLVVQSFLKIPSLHALAPTQAEPPFLIAQSLVLVAFVVVGFLAVRRFHPGPVAA
jgi:hypothetical protein